MYQECCVDVPNDNTVWLQLEKSVCDTTQNVDSDITLTQDIIKKCYEVAQTQSVENLSLSGNQLSHLPTDLAESLTTLVHLNLSNNKLNNLPSTLKILKRLVYLNLDHNKFMSIPDVICELNSLKTLTMQANCIKKVPQDCNDLSNLKNLNLSFNCLEYLPVSYENLNNLRNLSLNNNRFKMIPKCVTNGMHNLQIFEFSRNYHSDLNISPKSVNIIAFYAEENNTCPSFPLWVLDTKYNKLDIVSLNGTRFKEFDVPDDPCISYIKKLSMKQCKMFESIVNRIISGMINLEQLILGNSSSFYGNQFWYMPIESLKEPSSLKEINVSKTGLPIIPRTINQYVNLSKMDISSNEINCLPDEICSLKNLTSLIADKNQLAMLPKNIGQMASLSELNLSHNNLYELPDSVELLSNLRYIDLYNNDLEIVPEVIGKLSNLIGVDLEQNYFKTDSISLNRDVHYENMRDIVRSHWSDEESKTIDGAKRVPPQESDAYSDERRRYSDSSSTSSSSLEKKYKCSYPKELFNQNKNEHWDSSEDTADEFDPHVYKEPKRRTYAPLTCYNPFRPTYCPANWHQTRTITRIVQMLDDGILVWPNSYEDGQFEDP